MYDRHTLFTLCLTLTLTVQTTLRAQVYRDDDGSEAEALQSTIAAELLEADGSLPSSMEEIPLGTLEPTSEANPESLPVIDGTEVIRERYPNRKVKLERHVIQDDKDNYVNHGLWKMWDPQGNVLAEGTFDRNDREGVWTRWYRSNNVALFKSTPFNQFTAPFMSQATFRSGKLEGGWTIVDANRRKVCEWNFSNGKRDGKSTWWYPNGRRMRELNYFQGELNGDLLEWTQEGRLVTRDHYDDGRRIVKRVDRFPNGQKKSEATYLIARLEVKTVDDWWNAQLAQYVRTGKDERHGPWITWYETGQKRIEGSYEHDIASDDFVWWHPNGQVALKAHYDEGKKAETWTWWHPNGQKSIQGSYVEGRPSGRWTWWQDSGKVAQRVDYAQGSPQQIAVESARDSAEPALMPETGRAVNRSAFRP